MKKLLYFGMGVLSTLGAILLLICGAYIGDIREVLKEHPDWLKNKYRKETNNDR